MTPDEAAQELVHAWRMAIQNGKRNKIFEQMQYIAVFEKTEQGWPHLHILARCDWLAQEWLSKKMEQYANSPIVDIRKVKSKKRAAWYVAKYTAKDPERFDRCKRYWRTHGYALTVDNKEKPVHDHFKGLWSDWHIQEVAGIYTANNYDLQWDSDHSFTATPKDIFIHQTAMCLYNHNKSPPQPGVRP